MSLSTGFSMINLWLHKQVVGQHLSWQLTR